MNDPLRLLKHCVALVPVSLLVLGSLLLLMATGVFIALFQEDPGGTHSTADSSEMIRHKRPLAGRQHRIRVNLSGPGRAEEWAAEQVRVFQFVKELKYHSDVTSVSASSFTERRTLHRYRFLLVSSPPGTASMLDWSITEILQSLGSEDDLLPVGKQGYPVGPIEPEQLSEREHSRLMNVLRGDDSPPDGNKHIIRFISPHEDTEFRIKHRIQRENRSASIVGPSAGLAGMEREVMLNAPLMPERHVPASYRNSSRSANHVHTDHRSFVISAIDQYLQSVLPCRMTGEAVLTPNDENEDYFTFTGSGSFNILHPSQDRLIGTLRINQIKFLYDPRADLITEGEIRGRIAITSFPEQHVLNDIQFLREPTIRISYQSWRRDPK